jgi:hypothetical protein
MIWIITIVELVCACVVVWHAIDRVRRSSTCTRLRYVIAWVAAGAAAMGVISQAVAGTFSVEWHSALLMAALALVASTDARRIGRR